MNVALHRSASLVLALLTDQSHVILPANGFLFLYFLNRNTCLFICKLFLMITTRRISRVREGRSMSKLVGYQALPSLSFLIWWCFLCVYLGLFCLFFVVFFFFLGGGGGVEEGVVFLFVCLFVSLLTYVLDGRFQASQSLFIIMRILSIVRVCLFVSSGFT